jgi:hypothetical protein
MPLREKDHHRGHRVHRGLQKHFSLWSLCALWFIFSSRGPTLTAAILRIVVQGYLRTAGRPQIYYSLVNQG